MSGVQIGVKLSFGQCYMACPKTDGCGHLARQRPLRWQPRALQENRHLREPDMSKLADPVAETMGERGLSHTKGTRGATSWKSRTDGARELIANSESASRLINRCPPLLDPGLLLQLQLLLVI